MNVSHDPENRIRAFDAWASKPLALWPGAVGELRAAVAEGRRPMLRAAASSTRLGGPGAASGLVVVVPMVGPIMRRGTWLSDLLGATVLSTLVASIRAAGADKSIKAIIIPCDSPGGDAIGCEEAASVIEAVAQVKPVLVSVEGLCCSAAYWLSCAASEIVASPSSLVGSIGVYAEHVSWAGAEKMAGLETTLVSSGARKVDGHPSMPLSDRARADIQRLVDSTAAAFVGQVARGRNVSPSQVRASFGEGAVVTAPEARQRGMIDTIGTVDLAIARAVSGQARLRASASEDDRRLRLRLGLPAAVDTDTAERRRRLAVL